MVEVWVVIQCFRAIVNGIYMPFKKAPKERNHLYLPWNLPFQSDRELRVVLVGPGNNKRKIWFRDTKQKLYVKW